MSISSRRLLAGMMSLALAGGVATPAFAVGFADASSIASAANSGGRIATGSAMINGRSLNWTAQSYVVGVTPTSKPFPAGQPATNPGGGDPRYLAPNSAGYSGTVGILMTYASGSRFVCSGTLVGARSIATAAHCVSSGNGVKDADLVRTQIFFQNDASVLADERVYGIPTGAPPSGVTVIDVGDYLVNSRYTGEVIDQNDIAVLTLAQAAPDFARVREIYAQELTGAEFNVNGYGTRSSVGGSAGTSAGATAPTGWRRQGDNEYDYRWGADEWDGYWTDRGANGENAFGLADVEYSYVADFDSGLGANNSGCLISAAVAAETGNAGLVGYGCTLGLGAREAHIAGGDSGGGAFINGQLASINSYGLSFGAGFGDLDNALNNTYGEFSGYVPTFIHADFIRNAAGNAVGALPETGTWLQMILGFGLIGYAIRRKARVTTVTA